MLEYGRIQFVNPISFLREVKMELEKVVWPTRRQALELTLLVVVISVVVGVYVGGLDFVFTSAMNALIK